MARVSGHGLIQWRFINESVDEGFLSRRLTPTFSQQTLCNFQGQVATSAFNSATAALRSMAMAFWRQHFVGCFARCVFGIGYQLVGHLAASRNMRSRSARASFNWFSLLAASSSISADLFRLVHGAAMDSSRSFSADRIGPHAKRRSTKSTTRNAMDAQTTVPRAGVSSAPIVYYPRATSKQMMMPKRATPQQVPRQRSCSNASHWLLLADVPLLPMQIRQCGLHRYQRQSLLHLRQDLQGLDLLRFKRMLTIP